MMIPVHGAFFDYQILGTQDRRHLLLKLRSALIYQKVTAGTAYAVKASCHGDWLLGKCSGSSEA
jgi:hypothetical protein